MHPCDLLSRSADRRGSNSRRELSQLRFVPVTALLTFRVSRTPQGWCSSLSLATVEWRGSRALRCSVTNRTSRSLSSGGYPELPRAPFPLAGSGLDVEPCPGLSSRDAADACWCSAESGDHEGVRLTSGALTDTRRGVPDPSASLAWRGDSVTGVTAIYSITTATSTPDFFRG